MKHILKWTTKEPVDTAFDFKQWAVSKLDQVRYTPDMAQLDQCVSQLLFVYDNTMTGHTFHSLLQGPKDYRVGPAFTSGYFLLPKRKLGENTYPILLPAVSKHHTIEAHPVRGELWCVPSTTIRRMDVWRENGQGAWIRKKIHIRIPYRRNAYYPHTNAHVELGKGQHPDMVWTYMGTELWHDRIDGGFEYGTVRRHQPTLIHRIPEYFWFTSMEYQD